jgi:uncharacterized protein (TIGR02996 family)
MPEEDALVRAILENPNDDSLRLVYADWLEERGDGRGEFLRVEAQLATNSHPKRSERQKLRARLDELRPPISKEWLALLDRTTVEGCFQFRQSCPKRWERLKTTEDELIRFCESCQKKVFFCATINDAQRHANYGHCVAIDSRVGRKSNDVRFDPSRDHDVLMLGMPAPPAPRYRLGQRIRIEEGLLKTQHGTIQRLSLTDLRARVVVETGSGPISVDLEFEQMVPAS